MTAHDGVDGERGSKTFSLLANKIEIIYDFSANLTRRNPFLSKIQSDNLGK